MTTQELGGRSDLLPKSACRNSLTKYIPIHLSTNKMSKKSGLYKRHIEGKWKWKKPSTMQRIREIGCSLKELLEGHPDPNFTFPKEMAKVVTKINKSRKPIVSSRPYAVYTFKLLLTDSEAEKLQTAIGPACEVSPA